MAYGDKRDYRKIDIYTVQGRYLCSTTWARTLKEAKQRYAEKEAELYTLRLDYCI